MCCETENKLSNYFRVLFQITTTNQSESADRKCSIYTQTNDLNLQNDVSIPSRLLSASVRKWQWFQWQEARVSFQAVFGTPYRTWRGRWRAEYANPQELEWSSSTAYSAIRKYQHITIVIHTVAIIIFNCGLWIFSFTLKSGIKLGEFFTH